MSEEEQRDRLPIEEVERLIELVRESGVGEIRVRQGELEVTVKASPETAAPQSMPRIESQPALPPEPEVEEPERNGLHAVRSPLVGTFYRAPAPGEDVYVEVGDQVVAGQTLCIVEAMKLMNEIPADVSGEVVEVVPQDSLGVEYDEPLFYLRPGE
ncbi:MAG: acetyl-CoA carboxylase biotin carboxyl carrier protein [Rubrobacteraceae bacterium]